MIELPLKLKMIVPEEPPHPPALFTANPYATWLSQLGFDPIIK